MKQWTAIQRDGTN